MAMWNTVNTLELIPEFEQFSALWCTDDWTDYGNQEKKATALKKISDNLVITGKEITWNGII